MLQGTCTVVLFPRKESKNRHRQQLNQHLHSKTIKNITVRFVGVEENIGGPKLAYCPENYSRKNRNAPLTERATIRYHQLYLHETACRPKKPPLLKPRQSHEVPVLFTQPFHSFDLQQNRANMR